MAGAPLGNQNARKAKLWTQALERALSRRGKGDMTAALDELADKFLQAVEDMTEATDKRGPSIAGFQELADRFEGKPTQAMEHSGPDGEALPALVNVTLTKPDA